MPQPRVDDFFDAMQLRAPQVFHFLEAHIHVRTEVVDARIGFLNACVGFTNRAFKLLFKSPRRAFKLVLKSPKRALLMSIPTRTISMVGAVLIAIVRIWVSVICRPS